MQNNFIISLCICYTLALYYTMLYYLYFLVALVASTIGLERPRIACKRFLYSV